MIRKNKRLLIITSLVTLLPMLVGLILWNRLPERMATHWGINGQVDGYGSLPFVVFGLPLIMLAGHWVCILATTLDPKNKGRNQKPLTMVLWIIPIVSNLCGAVQYSLALGTDFSPSTLLIAGVGLLFLVIGNYLPKCRQNNTVGIRVSWTLSSEENWNATHRFSGPVWVIGGVVMMFAAFLPEGVAIAVMFLTMLVLVIAPIAYSYRYYRTQKNRGEAAQELPKKNAKAIKIGLIITAVVLVFVCVILFTGSIHVVFGEDAFTVEASYYDDLTVAYESVTAVEYREGSVTGVRTFGFGSFRLLMGSFENQEFGPYTRYTYYNPDACVVLRCGEKTLVLSGADTAETQQIYRLLLEKTQK